MSDFKLCDNCCQQSEICGKEIELLEDWCFTVDGTDFWVHKGYRIDKGND